MHLTFHGGAKMVTGANYLLEVGDKKILVDCGLFQGDSYYEGHNWEPFLYDPKEIDAVFITHAHIDHTGRLPKLVKDGFRGTVYSTEPTRDFAEHLLFDSQHLLQRESEKHQKPLMYDENDIHKLMQLWKGVRYHAPVRAGNITATFYNAGHILGSGFIVVEAEGKKIVFSGDLGNSPAPIIGAREAIPGPVDYALVESTYGGRVHEPMENSMGVIEDMIEDTVKTGGTLMIPAFAMERTQKLLFEINNLVENGRVPPMPVFLDSPLAIKLTGVYNKHHAYWEKKAMELMRSGDALFQFPGLKKTLTTAESKTINDVPPPKVIIAGSGMSNGGRILHHEKRYLPDPNNTLFIVGYQAKGSLGRRILDGKKDGKPFSVKIFGEEVPVKCRVKAIGGFSAHADQPQLMEWLEPVRADVKNVFIVQGEKEQAAALSHKLRDFLTIRTSIPERGERVML